LGGMDVVCATAFHDAMTLVSAQVSRPERIHARLASVSIRARRQLSAPRRRSRSSTLRDRCRPGPTRPALAYHL